MNLLPILSILLASTASKEVYIIRPPEQNHGKIESVTRSRPKPRVNRQYIYSPPWEWSGGGEIEARAARRMEALLLQRARLEATIRARVKCYGR